MIALTNALNTTQQQLQDLINANAAAGAPPAPAAVAFAETPAKADPTAILDYTSKYGLAVYNYGKSSLYDEGTAKFDLDREKASRFEKDIKARVESMGWDHPYKESRLTLIPTVRPSISSKIMDESVRKKSRTKQSPST